MTALNATTVIIYRVQPAVRIAVKGQKIGQIGSFDQRRITAKYHDVAVMFAQGLFSAHYGMTCSKLLALADEPEVHSGKRLSDLIGLMPHHERYRT